MAFSNTPRPAYVYDTATSEWIPVGIGAHQHTNAADTPAVIPNALVDAKGDLLTATADNTPARLAVGSNNQVLTADSSTATGLKWAAPAGGGKVLQVVTATYSTATSSSSATYADTGLTATITPSSTSSKILVLVYHNGISKSAAVNYQQMAIKLFRGATEILLAAGINYNAGANDGSTTFATTILDSPATTSATTYKTQFNSAGVASVTIQNGNSTSTITLLEIGA